MRSEKHNNHVEVAVITASGRWPATGFEEVPSHQKVKTFLAKAARELKITSTEGWLASVGGRDIRPDGSYIDNALTGQIVIDFGPAAGGGGA